MEEFNGILPVEVHMRIDSSSGQVLTTTSQTSYKTEEEANVGLEMTSEAEEPLESDEEASTNKNSPTASSTPPPKRRRSKRNKTKTSEYSRMECNLCPYETTDGREALRTHYTDEHSKEDLALTLIDIIYPEVYEDPDILEAPSGGTKEKAKRRASLFPCPVCSKSIAGKNNLEKHLIRHRSQKPFKCDECKKMFSAKRDLQLHEMRHHSKERPHVCPTCNKGFVDKAYLKKHMTFHDQSTTYVCDQCGKAFNNVLGLQKHCKTHSQERPYMCERCSKCFRVKYDLTVHKRNVHKEGNNVQQHQQANEPDSSTV